LVTCPNCGSEDIDLLERPVGACADWAAPRAATSGCEEMPPQAPRPTPPPARPGDPSSVFILDTDDEGYLAWTARHPTGFVINTVRPPGPGYLMLHMASCWHITAPEHTFSPTSWTGNDYSKVCGLRRADILAWSRERFGVEPTRCQHCDP